MPAQAAIQVSRLTKIYKGAAVPALNGIALNIQKGEVFGLLGPNGAGKTTTISILCGLLKPSSGEVIITGLSYPASAHEIKKRISLVPQDIALYPGLTAVENLEYIGHMYGMKGQVLKARISECLEIFGLTGFAGKRLETFSGGMKRRVNLIAGILHKPDVLLLDEPTVGVDVHSRSIIHDSLRDLNKSGTTIIYTSHLMEEAESLCTHLAIIDHGTIITEGIPKELISQHQCTNLEQLFLKLTGRNLRD